MVVGDIEVLDHVVDLIVEPGYTDRILAKAHLLTEPSQIANIAVVAGIHAESWQPVQCSKCRSSPFSISAAWRCPAATGSEQVLMVNFIIASRGFAHSTNEKSHHPFAPDVRSPVHPPRCSARPWTRLWRTGCRWLQKVNHGAMRLFRVPLETQDVVTEVYTVIIILVGARKRDRILGQAGDPLLVEMIQTRGGQACGCIQSYCLLMCTG